MPIALIVLLAVPVPLQTHEELLARRAELVESRPGLGGPIGMMLGGIAALGVGGFVTLVMPKVWQPVPTFRDGEYLSADFSRGAWYTGVTFGVCGMILSALGLGLQAFGIVTLVRHILQRAEIDTGIQEVDARLGP